VRAFLAIEIPADLKKYFEKAIAGMATRIKGIRWVKEEGLHITLKFLGEIDKDTAWRIKDNISSIGSDYRPFAASTGNIDAFPHIRKARVVVVGLEEGAETIGRIFADVEKGLSKLNMEPEAREYTPHITLGRAKTAAPLSDNDIMPLESKQFPVERVVLFESALTREGAIYTPRWDIKLGG
jgi:RNA 2',3'-cyclic 3'-phosphodiesterase